MGSNNVKGGPAGIRISGPILPSLAFILIPTSRGVTSDATEQPGQSKRLAFSDKSLASILICTLRGSDRRYISQYSKLR
jgi:hypothetical protein